MKIAIIDDYQDVVRTLGCYDKLAGHEVTIWNHHTKDVGLLARRLHDTEALVLIRERTPIPGELIRQLPKLRIISQNGVYPHVDVEACTRHGVILSSGMGTRPSYATAELAWGLMIAAMRRIPQEMAALKAGHWQSTMGQGMRGKTLGIYGFGRIGSVMAGYAKAFGMKVLVWGREGSLARAREQGHDIASSREAFFGTVDVLTLQIRATEETRGIVTAADLARMKPSALLVNTSRASLIEEGALLTALRSGRPGMAALDVFDEEPVLGAADPLVQLPNVVCTPHLGYVEVQTYEFALGAAFDQVLAYAAGKPVNVVNPEALTVRTESS